jgi:hypothetical protein
MKAVLQSNGAQVILIYVKIGNCNHPLYDDIIDNHDQKSATGEIIHLL